MSTKKAIKSIKLRLQESDHEAALYESTQLIKTLGKTDPDVPQILCYRGLALTHLGKIDEAEKCYIHAFTVNAEFPLAAAALQSLYKKNESWNKLERLLEVLVQSSFEQNDAEKCASTLQDLVALRVEHGPEQMLYQTLALLLPSSPVASLVSSLSPPQPYTPSPLPTYPPTSPSSVPSLPTPLPHVLHLMNSLPLLLHILIRSQAILHTTTEAKVKAARQRLGAGTEKEVRRTVEGQVLSEEGMGMVDLLREVGNHNGVSDEIRRNVEVKEFGFWRKLVSTLGSIPETKQDKGKKAVNPTESPSTDLPLPALFQSKSQAKPTREDAKQRVDDLANGFVLLGVGAPGAEEAWSWVLEGKDEPTLFYDLDLLHKYAHTFPVSSMTDFIDDYCRWFRLPLPDPEESDALPAEGAEVAIPKAKKGNWRKKSRGVTNARERRKARRQAGKDGGLAEDLDQEERDELVASMTKLLDKLPKSIFAHRVMARISIEEEDWANAMTFAEKGRALLKELEAERGVSLSAVRVSLDTVLAVALVPYFPPKHHPRATKLLNSILHTQPDNAEARFARASIFQAAGNWSEARKHFQTLLDQGGDEKAMVAAKEELGWCLVNEGKLEEGRDVLEGVVEIRDSRYEKQKAEGKESDEGFERARAWWRLGRTEWDIGDDESRQHAEDWFMASMRALPTYAPAYAALGQCYLAATSPDEERALKCFQKAFELDATETEAAKRLASGYADQEEWSLVRQISMRVMEGEGGLDGVVGGDAMNPKGRFAPKNGWAWKALGSTEVHYKNYAKAAQAYQIALRAEPDDVSTWVMLGQSYVSSGRHIAGLKALGHALELDPTNWMAKFYIGETQFQLGAYDLAIEAYEAVTQLTQGKEEVGVTAALGEAYLSQGRQTSAGGFRERSRRAFHSAISLAGTVLSSGKSHRLWAWKVVGDACFELNSQESSLPDAAESFDILRPILELLVADDVDRRSSVQGLGHASSLVSSSAEPTTNTTLMVSIFAYAYRAHLLKQERNSDSAMYDLASALQTLALRTDDEHVKTACVKNAISAVRLALEKDPGDERLWNALGVICAGAGAQIAQHAFVVSLELYSKDPVVWGNLGWLYLKLDEGELANQCFLKAQVIDPDYARAWLGQGLLAERNGDKEHAKALFAHSVTLSAGSLLEADLAMAVTTFLPYLQNPLESVSELHLPAFALKQYCHQRPRDSSAAHLYALICERLGLTSEAVTALERAAFILEEEFEQTENEMIEQSYSIALCNLGRVLLTAGEYAKSLETFTNCLELVSGSTETSGDSWKLKIQSLLGQGLAQFWLSDVDASLECFQGALDEAGKGNELVYVEEIAVLLSRTLWGLGGDDAKEVAKSHLMECLSHENPSVKVISTLAAIAVVTSDEDLLDASISELSSLPIATKLRDLNSLSDLVLSSQALSEGDTEKALAILESANLTRPGSVGDRNRYVKLLIQTGDYERALEVLGGNVVGGSEERAVTLGLRGVARVLNGDESGLEDLQRGVMLQPWDEAGWQTLAWGKKVVAEAEAEVDAPVDGETL